MDSGLIFDIGANNGDDTAYYLHRGYRVVAVEANPAMVAHLRTRFADALAANTLTLLPLGIAAEAGEFEFWVCDDNPDWSSFDQATASRNGARHHRLRVPTRRFGSITDEFGIPYYCKIDIEGNDRLCLQDMRPGARPAYVSVEMSHSEGDTDLELLRGLGYGKFKIVSQVTRTQPFLPLTGVNFRLPPRPREVMIRLDRKLRGATTEGDWYFPFGCSGPFGQHTPGPWRDYASVRATWQRLHDLDVRHAGAGLGDWYDIHAAS
ncbi:MAG: hypothetical protein NVSMB18_32550 [Acetobacteraceae bacterium]